MKPVDFLFYTIAFGIIILVLLAAYLVLTLTKAITIIKIFGKKGLRIIGMIINFVKRSIEKTGNKRHRGLFR